MDSSIVNLISELILQVKQKHNNLTVDFLFDASSDTYEIWHNNEHLEFEDIKFSEFVGSLIKEKLYDNGVFNVSFGYDHVKAKELSNFYSSCRSALIGKQPESFLISKSPIIADKLFDTVCIDVCYNISNISIDVSNQKMDKVNWFVIQGVKNNCINEFLSDNLDKAA